MHDFLTSEMNMPPTLLEALCTWADTQSLIFRCSESDVVFKPQMARSMLSVAVSLYRWHRSRISPLKSLGLISSGSGHHNTSNASMTVSETNMKMADNHTFAHDVEDGDLMEATDAGGEENSDNEYDVVNMDPDTENEMGNMDDPDHHQNMLGNSDDDDDNQLIFVGGNLG